MTNKLLWFLLAAAICLGCIRQFYPLADATLQFRKLPVSGPGFTSKEIPLSESEKELFYDVNVLKRLYSIAGQNFYVILLDGTNNRHRVHDPRYCIRGSGWTILSETPIKTNNGDADLVLTAKDNQKRETLYWYSNGLKQYFSPMRYWYEATLRRLSLGKSGPEPILIFVQPVDQERPDWSHLQTHFKELFNL